MHRRRIRGGGEPLTGDESTRHLSSLGAQTRELSLIKDNIPADDRLLGGRIVAPPPLVALFKAKVDAGHGVGLKVLPLVLANMHISTTAKHPQRGKIRLVAMQGLIRGHGSE